MYIGQPSYPYIYIHGCIYVYIHTYTPIVTGTRASYIYVYNVYGAVTDTEMTMTVLLFQIMSGTSMYFIYRTD